MAPIQKVEPQHKWFQGAKRLRNFEFNPTPVPSGPAFVYKARPSPASRQLSGEAQLGSQELIR